MQRALRKFIGAKSPDHAGVKFRIARDLRFNRGPDQQLIAEFGQELRECPSTAAVNAFDLPLPTKLAKIMFLVVRLPLDITQSPVAACQRRRASQF